MADLNDSPRVVILGGGLTGISAALHLKQPWTLIEKDDRLGGHARTEETRGFYFDKTGHWLHLRDPSIKALVAELLPDQMTTVARKASIFSNGVLTRYPFQGNLYGLPPAVLSECLIEFVRAQVQEKANPPSPPKNFEEFCLQKFGAGISKHFMIPYNHKLWGVHPREITSEWCSRFVPIPKMEDVIKGAVGDLPPEIGYNISFLYPKKGGIETLTRALVSQMTGGEVRLSTSVESIDLTKKTVTAGGKTVPYTSIVASIPLPEICRRIVGAPAEILEAAGKLRCTAVRYLNVATKRSPKVDFHWLYVPEEKYPFYRVGIYSNAVPSMAPEGKGSLYVELSDRGPLPSMEDLMARVAPALVECGIIDSPDDILFADLRELKYAYVVFDDNYYKSVATLTEYLESHKIYPRGRYGSWIYNAMEDSILAGREIALKL